MELLESIAQFLELPRDFFREPVRDGNSVLRLLHYPPTPPQPEGVRAEAHEDINVITLLLGAEEAGLQLLTREGAWLDVNPPQGGRAGYIQAVAFRWPGVFWRLRSVRYVRRP